VRYHVFGRARNSKRGEERATVQPCDMRITIRHSWRTERLLSLETGVVTLCQRFPKMFISVVICCILYRLIIASEHVPRTDAVLQDFSRELTKNVFSECWATQRCFFHEHVFGSCVISRNVVLSEDKSGLKRLQQRPHVFSRLRGTKRDWTSFLINTSMQGRCWWKSTMYAIFKTSFSPLGSKD
jgi:hypothetical protein